MQFWFLLKYETGFSLIDRRLCAKNSLSRAFFHFGLIWRLPNKHQHWHTHERRSAAFGEKKIVESVANRGCITLNCQNLGFSYFSRDSVWSFFL